MQWDKSFTGNGGELLKDILSILEIDVLLQLCILAVYKMQW